MSVGERVKGGSTRIGIIKETTGSVVPGLFALAAASTLAAGLVYFLKERRGPASPEHASGQESGQAAAGEALQPATAR